MNARGKNLSRVLLDEGRRGDLLPAMSTDDRDIACIEAMVEGIRAIRARTCEPKNQSNPRYHALSMAVSGLMKAADDMRKET